MQTDWIEKARNLSLRVQNFVDGHRREGRGSLLDKSSPRDGSLLFQFRSGEPADVEEVVASSRIAFEDGRWSGLPVQARKNALHKLASLVEHHTDELALLECLDVGKPISAALEFDIPITAASIRAAAESADRIGGEVYHADSTNLSYQLRRPMGVVAGIVGWNFPLLLAATKIGPALATGNCLILKPSELTSLATSRLAELALEAGIPEGVLNVIHGGPGVGAALAHHLDVDLVSFTGSTHTGKKLLIASAQSNMKRMLLECGGKAPNIVFDDCPPLDLVADAIVARAFWNQGQVCTASSRLLIQAGIKDELLRLLVRKTSALVPGDPLNIETKFGALVSQDHQKKVMGYIRAGEDEGARLLFRSAAPAPNVDGFYVPPVIFDNVSPSQKIAREEIFGPVLSVLSFRDESEAIRIANGTIYGLSAILWTKDMGRAHRLAQAIRAGWISVNATGRPAGGPGVGVLSVGGHNESGLGVEGGLDGLREYTSSTAVQYFV